MSTNGTTYSVGGPFSTYATPAELPTSVFSESGSIIEIHAGTHVWPATDFPFNNTTIVGVGGKDACILTGSINGSTASQGENFISGLTINGTASVPAIDMKATAQRCGVHVSDCIITGGTFAVQNAQTASTVASGDPATVVRNIWSSCTKGLSTNANTTAISSTMAGAWMTTITNAQAAAVVVGTSDLVYAAANAGNMTETITSRTIVS